MKFTIGGAAGLSLCTLASSMQFNLPLGSLHATTTS